MEICKLGLIDEMAIKSARKSHGQMIPSSSPPDDWSQFFSHPNNHGWGAYINGKLIGTVFLHPDARHPTHLILSGLWVESSHRGCGYGQDLTQHTLMFAEMECYQMVKLWVSELNTTARSLYKSMGFTPTGRLRAFTYEPFQHLQQLVLDLRQKPSLSN